MPSPLAGNGRHRQAVARAGIAAAKTVRVGAEEMALLGRHAGALAVGDALAGLQRGRLAFQRDGCGLLAGDGPGVEQVQVGVVGSNVVFVGQAGHRVFRGEARNVEGGLHGLLDRGARKIRRAGIAAAVAHVDGHAERLVTVALDVLQLALAHTHAQAAALGGLGPGVGGADLLCMRQGRVYQGFEGGTAVAEAAVIGLAGWPVQPGCEGVIFMSAAMILAAPCDPPFRPLHVPQTQKRLLRPRRVHC